MFSKISRLFRRARTLAGRNRVDADINRELNFHLAMETDHRKRSGAAPDDARRTTLRDFGGVDRIREEVRDVRGLTFWDSLSQDLRFGFRTLRRSPGYAFAAVFILALGIGVNTAMFSVIDGVLLKPLPFRDGSELVLVRQSATTSNVSNASVSIPELNDYRARLHSIHDLVEYHSMSFALLNQGEPDRVDTGVVSANFFDMLGIKPILGRTFVDSDDDLDADAVLVLSYEYWQAKFGGDRTVVGRVLEMNNRPHTVIGVLPSFPQYPRKNDVYMPTSACPFRAGAQKQPRQGHRSFAGLSVFGRLSPGATEESASSEIDGIAKSFEHDHPADYEKTQSRGLTGRARMLQDTLVSDARPMLLALTGATFLVLVIACANVANLSIARTDQRTRELAVRAALGAGRGRLMRQLITESVIVATIGGVAGLALANFSLGLLTTFVGRFTPRTGQIEIDGGVLTFALLASVVSGVVFGLAPAWSARRSLIRSMRDDSAQSGEGHGRHRLRAGLVIAQVAVSFVLLVGASLLLESFRRLSAVPLGYQTDHVMTAAYFGNFSRTSTPADALRLSNNVLEQLRAAPGVKSAALTNAVPQLANLQPFPQPFTIEGQPPSDRRLEADLNAASDGYFATLGIPLIAGRDIRSSDTSEAPTVAVINQSMAKLWKDGNALGGRLSISLPSANGPQAASVTVIGIAGDFRLYGADREVEAQLYVPFWQLGFGGGRLLVNSTGQPAEVTQTIKTAVHAADPLVPVEEVQTLDELRQGRLATPGLTTALLLIFAIVALVITLAGIAGLVGTTVSQRTREFGVRMALGASRGSVLRLVLKQGVVLVTMGLAAGLAGAYAFSHLIARYLFATRPTDPFAYAGVALVFFVVAGIAAFSPARRATTIDPLIALRTD